MQKAKFLKLFALIELLSAILFLSLAVVFFVSRDALGGDMIIFAVFGFIGICSAIAVPVLLKLAKKQMAGTLPEN